MRQQPIDLGEHPVSRRCFLRAGSRLGVAAAVGGATLSRAAPRPAQAAGITLTYLGLPSPAIPHALEKVLAEFDRTHPGIRTRFLANAGDYYDQIVTLLGAQDGSIDVFDADVIWQPLLARSGWILPLDHVFPPAARKDYPPAMIWADTIGAHIYGIPWNLDTGHLFYRKDILDANGLKPAATWAEMHDQGVMLAKKYPKMVPFVACYQAGQQLICNFLEYAWSNGGDMLDPNSGSVVFDSPQNLEALELMIALINDRVVQPGVVTMDLDIGRQVFTNGFAVYHRNWNYAYTLAQLNPRLAGKVGVAPMPHFPGGASAACAGGWSYAVNASSAHLDAAVEFARFMGSARMQVFRALHSGETPAYLPANTDPQVVKQFPDCPLLAAQARTARSRPKTVHWVGLSAAAEQELTNALLGVKSPQQALRDAQGKLETILAGT